MKVIHLLVFGVIFVYMRKKTWGKSMSGRVEYDNDVCLQHVMVHYIAHRTMTSSSGSMIMDLQIIELFSRALTIWSAYYNKYIG